MFTLNQHLTEARALEEVALGMIIERGPVECDASWDLIEETGRICQIYQKGDKARIVLSYVGTFCRKEVFLDLPASEVEVKVREKMVHYGKDDNE